MLVARLAKRWGTRYTQTGKTIWAQQPLTNDTNESSGIAVDGRDPHVNGAAGWSSRDSK